MLKLLLLQPKTLFSKFFDFKATALTHLLSLGTCVGNELEAKNVPHVIQVINLADESIYPHSDVKFKDVQIGEYLTRHLYSMDRYLERFDRRDRLIFGISAFSANYYIPSILMAFIIRLRFPDAKICVGGYHVNLKPDEFLPKTISDVFGIQIHLFDCIFLGECEKSLAKWVVEQSRKRPRDKNCSSFEIIGPSKVIDLDALPFVDYSLQTNFFSSEETKQEFFSYIPTFFSRGCPFNCNFCGDYRNHQKAFQRNRWRMKSPVQAADETLNIVKQFENSSGKRQIQIFDPLFAYPDWRVKYFKKLIERDFTEELWAELRIDQFSIKKEIPLLKKLKFTAAFGVESGNYNMLRIMNKINNPQKHLEKFPQIVKAFEKSENYVISNFIIGHPGETQASLKDTFIYIDDLIENSCNLIPSISKYMLTVGSQIYLEMEDYEKKYRTKFQYKDYWQHPKCCFESSIAVDPSEEMTYQEILKNGGERLPKLIAKAVRRFKCFPGRQAIFNRYKNHMMLRDIPFWRGFAQNG